MIFLKPSKQKFIHSAENEIVVSSKSSPYRDTTFLFFILLTMVFATCFFLIFSILPIYFKTVHHLTEIQIGGLQTMNGLIIVLFEMLLVYELEKRFKKMNIIALGLLCTGFS